MKLAELKNHERELYYFQLRVGFAGAVVLAAFALLFARFFYLQVVQHGTYASKAEDNRISIVPLAPNRGLILDRNGIVLARNYSAYTLEIFPAKVKDLERTIGELAEVALERVLKGQPNLETRKRVEALMEKMFTGKEPPADVVQALRGVEALEAIGSSEAKQALEKVAHLVGSSSWAAGYLQRHPVLLDELLDARILETAPDWPAFRTQLADTLDEVEPDMERQMDLMREIGRYNEVDCRAMLEIVEWLRAHR